MSTSKHHNGNPSSGETPSLPPLSLYDGLKTFYEYIKRKTIQSSKQPFGISEICLWTLFPLLSWYPMVICWNIVVHFLFWLPILISLAIYRVQNRHAPQNNTLWATKFLNRIPPNKMCWWLCFVSIGLTLATQLIFIAAWYAKRRAMDSKKTRDIEMTYESRAAPDRGYKDSIKGDKFEYNFNSVPHTRYGFVYMSLFFVGILTDAIVSVFLTWMPHLFRYLTFRIYDAIIPLTTSTTRVEDWLQRFQLELGYIPTLILLSIPIAVLPFLIQLPVDIISGAYRQKDEPQAETVSLSPSN